jgi:hypothetical protein
MIFGVMELHFPSTIFRLSFVVAEIARRHNDK